MWKQANFHMDFALYRLDMVGIEMASPNYISLGNLLRYFDHSNRIHVSAWIRVAKTMRK